MKRVFSQALVALLLVSWGRADGQDDIAGYRTVGQAITTSTARKEVTVPLIPAFLGVNLGANAQGRLVIQEVAVDSPAGTAGLRAGDLVLSLDSATVKDAHSFYSRLADKKPGAKITLGLARGETQLEVAATLGPLSRPKIPDRQAVLGQAVLGVEVVPVKEGDGVTIQQVAPGSPAEANKLKIGDIILKADNLLVTGPDKLREILASRKPDDILTLTIAESSKSSTTKTEKIVEKLVKLDADQPAEAKKKGTGNFGLRVKGTWTKPVYNLAVICVEYPDQKHNPKITSKDWEDSLFSTGTYTDMSVTGQKVFGSVNDLYLEQSFGKLTIHGKVFDFVEVSKKRGEYATGNRTALLTESTEKLLAREGKDALKKFDGVFFLYAGAKYPAPRGSLYWPHRGTFSHAGERWPYFICPEGGPRMANISVFAHEFGHMLSLPDLYARPENPGMEGLGNWCLMSIQVANGQPQHFCAWTKEKMGWIQPTLIDPTVKQKLVLSPIEDSPRECFKILVQRDASEYLLLENRARKGFDKSLPGAGLLIWRVVRNKPLLEESHGVEGPAGPSSFPAAVPYPSVANESFTPFTTPSSRSHLDGGRPVFITNIRRLADGRISFHIGYEYQ